MNRFRLPIAAGIALAAAQLLFASSASAQNCACVIPIAPSGTVVGNVSSPVGNVQVSASDGGGFVDAAQRQSVAIGSSVITGADGTATVSIGTGCTIRLTPNSTLTVTPTGTNICVALDTAQAGGVFAGNFTPWVGFGAFAIASTFLIIDSEDDDAPVSGRR